MNRTTRIPLILSLGISALIGIGPPVAGQQAKTPLAKVTVSGKEMGTVNTFDGTTKDRYVNREVDQRTTIKIGTTQDVTKFPEEVLAEHEKLLKAFEDKVKKLIEKKDFNGFKKMEKDF